MEPHKTDANRSRSETTARIAVLAGIPGLVLIGLAAMNSNSLALHADLILSFLDMLVLLTVWVIAFRGRHASGRHPAFQRAEHFACTLAACCMILSMAMVAWFAMERLAAGGVAPAGTGVGLGFAVNVVFAVANLLVLRRWRFRYQEERSPFVRSQVCLFWDKLCTNLIVAGSLGIGLCFPDGMLARHVDPVASLLIVAATVRWTVPVLRDVIKGMRIGWCRRRLARTAAPRSA